MRRLERILCACVQAQLDSKKPRAPDTGSGLLTVFGQLSGTRSWHANGPNPITFTEIDAYCRLMSLPLRPEHVAIIQSLDNVWTSDFYGKRDQARRKIAAPMVSSTPLSAGLFDAMTGGESLTGPAR